MVETDHVLVVAANDLKNVALVNPSSHRAYQENVSYRKVDVVQKHQFRVQSGGELDKYRQKRWYQR